MAGIYIAGLIAVAMALAAVGAILAVFDRRRWWLYALLLLVELPMSAAAFYYLRVPLDGWVKTLIAEREAYAFVTTFYAPLTEEPAKLWPLLMPLVWRRLALSNALAIALALGAGFGIGEIGFLADRVAQSPAMAKLPWGAFLPFILERVLVCVWHAGFVAVTVYAAARRPALVPLAVLGSMALHFVGNFPIYLGARNAFALGREAWQLALFAWTLVYTMAMAAVLVFVWLRGRAAR